ncbi:unknown [Ruminococcus sp. CAG:382]|jgi:hypothetical protein|nr:hypothetical protein [Ruminococcus sp.]MDD6300867.1 hypothetical protein [Ruminococcus sp.]CDD04474.1 unknown [Ruminococcus sp. CAG:382]
MKRTAKLNLLTAVCSGMLAAIFQIVFCFAPSMAMQVVLLVVTALLYLTPFVINLKTVRDYCIDRVSRFVLYDLLFVLAPAAFISVLTELIVTPFAEVRLADGIASLILIGILLVESLIFWLAYYITYKLSDRK